MPYLSRRRSGTVASGLESATAAGPLDELAMSVNEPAFEMKRIGPAVRVGESCAKIVQGSSLYKTTRNQALLKEGVLKLENILWRTVYCTSLLELADQQVDSAVNFYNNNAPMGVKQTVDKANAKAYELYAGAKKLGGDTDFKEAFLQYVALARATVKEVVSVTKASGKELAGSTAGKILRETSNGFKSTSSAFVSRGAVALANPMKLVHYISDSYDKLLAENPKVAKVVQPASELMAAAYTKVQEAYKLDVAAVKEKAELPARYAAVSGFADAGPNEQPWSPPALSVDGGEKSNGAFGAHEEQEHDALEYVPRSARADSLD